MATQSDAPEFKFRLKKTPYTHKVAGCALTVSYSPRPAMPETWPEEITSVGLKVLKTCIARREAEMFTWGGFAKAAGVDGKGTNFDLNVEIGDVRLPGKESGGPKVVGIGSQSTTS